MRTENSSLSDWLSALAKVTGKAPRRSGDEYRSPCPAHGGNGFNLAIVERSGKILTTCHSHGCRHEDIREAIGLDQPARVNGSRSGPVPTHRNATREPEDRRWTYFNEHGDRHLDVVRTEGPEGKRIRRDPAGVEGPHPLYNLRELLECPDDPVLVVEGEKAADAAAELFRDYVVVTSMGGSGAAKQSNWTPSRDRDFVIWPDADVPGRKYAETVRELARAAGARSVRIVEVPSTFPDKWDVADPAPEGADLRALLESRVMLPVKRLDLWLAESDDPVEWLVDNLLHRHGTSVVGGGKGVGKTLFARTLCAAVATGKRLLGRDVRQGRVVYVGREDGKATTKAHFRTLGAANQNIYGMANEGAIHGDHLDLLRGTIEHIRPSLVVIDTLIKFVRIADMTRYENTVYAIEPFDHVARELGCHIMFTTHNRKSGDTGEEGLEILGSVGVQAAADSRLSIIRQAGARWVYGEGRDDAKLEKVQLVKDENGWVDVGITKRASDARELSSRIVDLLDEEGEPMARTAIQSRLGVRKETVMSALNALVQDSDVVCIGRGNRTRYACGSRDPLLEVGTGPQTMEDRL